MARKSQTSTSRTDTQLPRATLGKRREARYTYDKTLLEAIPLGGRGMRPGMAPMWVTNSCLRFTSLCPVTGQPDWADLHLNYIPDRQLVESKSLKEYLGSFRMHGDFHEDVCRIICADLVGCMAPRYIEVIGHFDSRGSIAIWPYVQYAQPGDAMADEIREHRFKSYAPGAFVQTGHGRQI